MSRNVQAIVVPVGRPRVERPTPPPSPAQRSGAAEQRAQTPPIDIHEGPEGLVLEADLPGVGEQAVQIHLEENVLDLTAETVGLPGAEIRVLHQEFASPGTFQRSFILSDEVDRAGIAAEMRNGVLRLVLPRAERLKSRRIEVKGSPAG